MVTSNVLQRTFRIAFNGSAGTGFTIDVDSRRYLVTAKHVVAGMTSGDELMVANGDTWIAMPIGLIGHASDPVDISVLSLPGRLSPDHKLPGSSEGLILGQEVFFAGFPFGLHTCTTLDLNANYPIAFVKRGIISAFGHESGSEVFYLDAHNNPGFSGGPIVFRPKPGEDYAVAAVVSGYRFNAEPVFRGEAETDMRVRANTGIVIGWPIRYALEVIRRTPNGLAI